jgi:hypothetical protein
MTVMSLNEGIPRPMITLIVSRVRLPLEESNGFKVEPVLQPPFQESVYELTH